MRRRRRYPFFVFYSLSVEFIFMNVFVNVVLDKFEEQVRKADLFEGRAQGG